MPRLRGPPGEGEEETESLLSKENSSESFSKSKAGLLGKRCLCWGVAMMGWPSLWENVGK